MIITLSVFFVGFKYVFYYLKIKIYVSFGKRLELSIWVVILELILVIIVSLFSIHENFYLTISIKKRIFYNISFFDKLFLAQTSALPKLFLPIQDLFAMVILEPKYMIFF